MEHKLTYAQAIFGLMLLGAKADGAFQSQEKELILELTSDVHPISSEEYRLVIEKMRGDNNSERFNNEIYATLNAASKEEKLEALYWLLKLINIDESSNDNNEKHTNTGEMNIYHRALANLSIHPQEVLIYEKQKS